MRHVRFTIARLLGLILFFGVVLAGLRSGSNDWFKSSYSLTFLMLVYAAIAARYRGAFWYGFAIAGWAYFVVGFGPWIGSPSGSPPPGAVNRNLVSSVVLEIVSDTMSRRDSPAWSTGPGRNLTRIIWANRGGIAHCALTILFAFAGGLVSRALARRSTTDSASEDRNRAD
jgi:hypothetical protein